MKFLGYIFLFLFSEFSFAQNNDAPEVFTQVETMPEFTGGAVEMMKFIQSNIQITQKVKNGEVSGKCFLKFTISEKGEVYDVKILKGVLNCEECDKEAIRVVSLMPKWKPGTQNGRPVAVFFNLPINFDLRGGGSSVIYETPNSKPTTFSYVNKSIISAPSYKGGNEEMFEFISKNKKYSEELKNSGVVGEVVVKFLVDSTGKINNPTVRQSSGNSDLDNEGIRIVSIMPRWIPAYLDGKKRVDYNCSVPISFGNKKKLDEFKKKRYDLSNQFFSTAMTDFQSNNLLEAKEKYRKAYELNCNHGDALYNLGVTYFKLNQKDSACVYWNDFKANFAKHDADELIKKYCTN